MKATSLVSIGIPTFNRAGTLRRAIDSALSQTHRPLEVVISDNASNDETEELCRRYGGRIHYIRQPSNQGATANFLAVLRAARGDFFMWLGDDDWLDPNYVEQCLSLLNADHSLSLAAGKPEYYRPDGNPYFHGVQTDLREHAPASRLIKFFWTVGDNGAFYGLMRREEALRWHLSDVVGGDHVWLAQLAWDGKVCTVSGTTLHRTERGLCLDLTGIALAHGYTPWQARFWDVIYVKDVTRGVCQMLESRASRFVRIRLATYVAAILWYRYCFHRYRNWFRQTVRPRTRLRAWGLLR